MSLRTSLSAGLAIGLAAVCLRGQPLPPSHYVPVLEKTLIQNILDFWLTKTIDTQNGGYRIRVDPAGNSRGDGPKAIVTQARNVWLYSRAARAGFGDRKRLLAAAGHGYTFLTEKMWDAKNGGFHWEVDAAGQAKTKPNKHLYGQAFGLYAISEYAMASGRKDALQFATRFFELLESKAHDSRYGGYREYFAENWSTAPPSEPSYMGGGAPGIKLMNTHLHLMEAVSTFYRASKLPLARERLLELIQIQSNAVVRKHLTACTDQYEEDWTPRLDGANARVSYGHDLENIWLLVEASESAGVPYHALNDLFRELFQYSLRYGWDTERGGFFYTGWFRQPADNRNKSWWVGAEALVSALTMYKIFKDPRYYAVFEKQWDFLNRHQIDWKNGEWHDTVLPDLTVRGDKAHAWKAGYHQGRAMIESLRLLKEVQPPATATAVNSQR